jgi:Flp pilus assembly protein TadD
MFPGHQDARQALRSMARAYELLSSDPEITYLLALALYNNDRLDEAREFIGVARSRAHQEESQIEELSTEIEAAIASLPAATQPGVGATPATP